MINKGSCLIILLSFYATMLTAQTTVVSDLVSGTHYQAAVGYKYQRLDMQALNQALITADYPALPEGIHALGFLTNRISGKWVLSLKTFYGFTNEVKTGSSEIEYRLQQYALGIGYNVLKSDKLKLVPSVMAALGRNVLLIQDKGTPAASFQDMLLSPDQEADLRNFTYLTDVGVALHYQFLKKTKQKELGPKTTWIPLVLKAGYQFQLGASDFKFDGERVVGVPELGMEGFYVSAFIGLGSKMLVGK